MPRGDSDWASRFFVIEIEERPLPPQPPLREDAMHRQAAAGCQISCLKHVHSDRRIAHHSNAVKIPAVKCPYQHDADW